VDGVPDVLGDDPELGRVDADPLANSPGSLLNLTPSVALLRLVPDDHSTVQLAVQDLPD
jgi:hypothetical protein